MKFRLSLPASRFACFATCLLTFLVPIADAQATAPANPGDAELKFVVYISRHGVRSPTGKPAQYGAYASAPWPAWSVEPGYLTPHGYQLMKLFGAYDRTLFSSEGLFPATGCTSAVTFYADSDQRTQQTGKALAEGLFPGCPLPVQALPEGTNDPLFHIAPSMLTRNTADLATAAIAGRIGNDPAALTEAYRTPLTALDHLLATCGRHRDDAPQRISLFDVPSSLEPGKGDHVADLHGPINTAATLAENLLLEYTEGMDASQVGWGCVDASNLRSLIGLHTAASDFAQRTPAVARIQASNLLDHINRVLTQAVTGKPIQGAIAKPDDRALFLIGHDTNLANLAGLLNLTWIADGRRDDTAPGGALVFELWRSRTSGAYTVRTFYTVQTLEQMRSATPLTQANPPARVPVFLPGCGTADLACPWPAFNHALEQAVDLRYVNPK